MTTIPGTNAAETLVGTAGDDTILAQGGNDLIAGEGGADLIEAGDGNDTVFGDAGTGTAPGLDASPLQLSAANVRRNSQTEDDANEDRPGDSVIYDKVAVLEDGTQISARLTLVSRTNSKLTVDLTGPAGAEILLNGENKSSVLGAEATFKLEFINTATGAPVALNSVATFNDIDQDTNGTEAVKLTAAHFSRFSTAQDTSLAVQQNNGQVIASGTEPNDPSDQDAWFSGEFENRSFIEFTLVARGGGSGYTLSGNLIGDPLVTEVIAGGDTILGGAGNDVIYGQGGDDSLEAGSGTDTLDGGAGDDRLTGGGDNDLLRGGDGADTITIASLDGVAVTNTTVEGGSGGNDVDTLDISGLITEGWKVTSLIKNPDNQTGAPGGPDQPGFSGQIQLSRDGVAANLNYTDIEQIVICFTPGTLIATPRGEVAIEALRAGDRVFTRDNGIQTIRWIGRRDLTRDDLAGNPALRPVRIAKGALGNGLPEADMQISPNHRMLLTWKQAELLFDEREKEFVHTTGHLLLYGF